jgi:hypothetical protein
MWDAVKRMLRLEVSRGSANRRLMSGVSACVRTELMRGINAAKHGLFMDLQSIGANDIRFPGTHHRPQQHVVDSN